MMLATAGLYAQTKNDLPNVTIKDLAGKDVNIATLSNDGKPFFITFWATWCGPCRMLSPVLEDLAEERPDIKVGKVNIDEQSELANQFHIMSIPTLLVFKNGKKTGESVGVIPKSSIEVLLE